MILKRSELKELIQDPKNGMSIFDLGVKYRKSRQTIVNHLTKRKIPFKRLHRIPLTESEIKFVVDNFSLLGASECARRLKCSQSIVWNCGKKLKLKPKIKGTTLIDGKFTCLCCNKLKFKEAFRKLPRRSSGRDSWCKDCVSKTRRSKREDILLNKEQRKLFWLKSVIYNAKCRAKKRSLQFSLTPELLFNKIPNFCPILGIELVFLGTKKARDFSASLDRIDNTKGYTLDNTIIVSYRANSLKRDSTHQERQKIVDFYKDLEQNKVQEDYSI